MVAVRADGLPIGVLAAAANVAENRLAEPLLDAVLAPSVPARLTGDKAYDDDALRDRLAARGVALLAPHRQNRVRPARHDGRNLRRYWRRYVVERCNAWLEAFKRVATRYEYYPFIYVGFAALAALITVARTL